MKLDVMYAQALNNYEALKLALRACDLDYSATEKFLCNDLGLTHNLEVTLPSEQLTIRVYAESCCVWRAHDHEHSLPIDEFDPVDALKWAQQAAK